MDLKLLGFFVKDVELPPPLWENGPPGFLVLAHASETYPAVTLLEHNTFDVSTHILTQDELLSEFHPASKALHAVWAESLQGLQRLLAEGAPKRDKPQSAGLLDAIQRLCRRARDLPGQTARRPEQDVVREVIESADFSAVNNEFNHILVEAAIGHRRAGNHHQAIFYYQKARQTDPENTSILFNLARVYHELGGSAEARTILDQILALNPNMQVARQYREFLSEN